MRVFSALEHEHKLVAGPIQRPHATVGFGPDAEVQQVQAGSAAGRKDFGHVPPIHKAVDQRPAAAAITDPPYNVKIDGHVSGKGKTSHREFAMASGEMSEDKFTDFLQQTFQRITTYSVKPIALVADAMLDCTQRNDIVFDPHLGSGTTILAAERTGRRCHAIEIDGRYVDTAIRRWERPTKQEAKDINGKPFAQTISDRGADQ